MKTKTITKTKGKTSPKTGALSGKKIISIGKAKAILGWKQGMATLPARPKSGVAAGKAPLLYGTHKPVVLELHEPAIDAAVLERTPKAAKAPAVTGQISREAALSHKLVEAVASSGPDVNALCETYQLRREELGRLTGFSLRALAEWASGKLPSQPAQRRLHEVRRLLDALSEIVKRESIPQWLRQPNPTFDKMTPLQVIELGEIDRLWAMVHDLGSGQPT